MAPQPNGRGGSPRITAPRTDTHGLNELAPLWLELHQHHREVSDYDGLVQDPAVSWARRLAWYRRLIAAGGAYLTATDDDGHLTGYAMVAVDEGPDDTFEVVGGIAEVVTLIVTRGQRSSGVGRELLVAAEDFAISRGFDTVKIAVMTGNMRTQRFYEANGYSVAEHVLYRRLSGA
jgi:GNAT superfamily N-acetyltransferase